MTDKYQYPIDEKMPLTNNLAITAFLGDYGQDRPDLALRFKQQGGKATGLNIIAERTFPEDMRGRMYVIGSANDVVSHMVHMLNWHFWFRKPKDKSQLCPFFKISEWALRAGPVGIQFEIKLKRADEAGTDYYYWRG